MADMTDPIGDVPSEPPSEEPQDGTAEAGGETHDLSDDDADEQAARIRRLREAGLSMTHQGARILGRSFISAGAVGYGSGDSAETINNYYGTAPEPDPDDGRVAEQQLEDLRKFYVRPPPTPGSATCCTPKGWRCCVEPRGPGASPRRCSPRRRHGTPAWSYWIRRRDSAG